VVMIFIKTSNFLNSSGNDRKFAEMKVECRAMLEPYDMESGIIVEGEGYTDNKKLLYHHKSIIKSRGDDI
jgi:hypothetical protein